MFGEEGDVIAETDVQVIITAKGLLGTGTVLLSPLISDLASVFAVSDARAGLLITVYAATVMVTLPVAGVIADRIGRSRSIALGVATFGIAGAAIALVDTFEAALGLRIVQAAGAAFAKPILVAALGDLYAGSREATAQSVRVAFDQVVGVITPVVAGVLFVAAWQYPFLVYLFAVPVAGWLWFSFPSLESSSEQSLVTYIRDLITVVSDRVVGLLMASFVVRMVLMYGLYTYVSVLAIHEAGLAVLLVGVLLSMRSVAKFVSATQVGRLTTRIDPVVITLFGFGLAGSGLLAMGLSPTSTILFAGVMIYGFGDGLLSPAQKSLVNRLSPPDARGGTMAAAYTCQNIGKTIGPLGLGVVLGIIGPAPAFVLLGGIGGGIGVGLLFAIWWQLSR